MLVRAPEVGVRLRSNGQVQIAIGRSVVEGGPHTLRVLEACAAPVALSALVRTLEADTRGAADWIDLTGTILRLHEAGVLRDAAGETPALGADPFEFDAAAIHISLLNDRTRTARYLDAIQEVVRPGDVVVEIGTGTGVLAVAAARAGARRVYAIEAGGLGRAAEEVFQANGVADRVTLVTGWSTRIDLPERGDVLVSEILGNDPLSEQVLEATGDALTRLLRPSASLVPRRIAVHGVPVSVPAAVLARHQFTPAAQQAWGGWYGMDFSPLAAVPRPASYTFFVTPADAAGFAALGPPVLLADIDLGRVDAPRIDVTRDAVLDAPGRLNGLFLYFELELSPRVRLSTHPSGAGPAAAWGIPLWLMPDPLDVRAGDRVAVSYTRRVSHAHPTVHVARASD